MPGRPSPLHRNFAIHIHPVEIYVPRAVTELLTSTDIEGERQLQGTIPMAHHAHSKDADFPHT